MGTKQIFYLCGIACLILGTTVGASAQYVVEERIAVAEIPAGKIHYYEESNLDNWYLSVGAGAQTFLSENKGSDAQFTLAMNVAAGKWITPYWGMRMSGMAGSLRYNWDVGHEGSMRYGAFYVDMMWEMTNSVFGYDERRVLSVVPFIGLGGAYGWHHTDVDDDRWAMPVTGGIKLSFRLGHYVDFFVEGRVQAYADDFNNVRGGSQIETAISAVGGLTFKFRSSRFKAYDPMLDQLAIAELNRRTNQLRAELEKCQAQKKQQRPAAKPTVKTETIVVEKPCCESLSASVSFAINSATVSQREMVNVYNVAQWLKDNPDCKVTIVGYADRGTGSADYNMQLSRRRAEAVAAILQDHYGIAASRIVIECEGSNEQPYPGNNDWNRIVIFTGSGE